MSRDLVFDNRHRSLTRKKGEWTAQASAVADNVNHAEFSEQCNTYISVVTDSVEGTSS